MVSGYFPYRKHAGSFYPTIPITVSRFGKFISMDALIDSGANFSGIFSEISGHLHTLELKVFETPLQCEVGFSRKMQTSFNILGRKDFFDLHEITFKEKDRQVVIPEI